MTHYQKRLVSLQSKRKLLAQQPAVSSVPQPLVVELKKQEPTGGWFAGKTAWDWLQLLVIPLALLLLGSLFSYQQNQTSLQMSERQHQTDLQMSERQHQTDLQIADDQQQEATLKAYLDDMSNLLLNQGLRHSTVDEARQIARQRTLTALRRLNAKRNQILLQFLQDARLIGWKSSVVDLSEADLSGEDLKGVNLRFVDLHHSNLSGVDLSGADLSGADLSTPPPNGIRQDGADLHKAILSGAYLYGANLHNADLSGAILQGAHLDDLSRTYSPHVNPNLHATDLSGADLDDTNLRGASLWGANLKMAFGRADMRDTNLSDANLKGAALEADMRGANLHDAVMPDGSKHS